MAAGRVALQIQAAIQQAVGQSAVLRSGIILPIADMLGEGDAAFAVPVFDIIKRGRHAGVAGIGKGGRCGQQAEHAAQHQHRRAVFGAVGQVGFVPRGSAGAQPHKASSARYTTASRSSEKSIGRGILARTACTV